MIKALPLEVLLFCKNLNCGMENNHKRCPWCEGDALYEQYHDKEWGVPIFDDLKLFEFLTLETFQAGLSWITILRKRDHFRKAFDQFDYEKVARYGDEKIDALLNNQGIIRNKQKIKANLLESTLKLISTTISAHLTSLTGVIFQLVILEMQRLSLFLPYQ